MSETPESGTATDPRDTVTLKNLFGFKPGVYLTVLYSSILLLALLAIFLLPGLLKRGSLVTFRSEPAGCAIRVDDVYQGITPCSLFVPAGKHTITFASPGFSESSEERLIGSRLFASLFFPRRQDIFAKLESPDPAKGFLIAAHEYASWAMAGEPTATWQIPMVLSEAAYRLGSAAQTPAIHGNMKAIIRAATMYTSNDTALRDLIRADLLTENAGLASSPLTLLACSRQYIGYLSQSTTSALWLSAALGQKAPAQLTTSDWYKNQATASSTLATAARSMKSTGATGRSISIRGIRFVEVAAGELIPQGTIAHRITVAGFWIADEEIDEKTWALFTGAISDWDTGNKSRLVEQGKATEGYLVSCDNPRYPHPSRSGVSWYAATAFCSWLTLSKPANFSSLEIRLPTEWEWERAASIPGLGLKHMNDGLWEWCMDSYAPADYVGTNTGIALSGSERCVRGGSWANSEAPVTAGTRASLPPETCSEFTGFRPVIAISCPPEQ